MFASTPLFRPDCPIHSGESDAPVCPSEHATLASGVFRTNVEYIYFEKEKVILNNVMYGGRPSAVKAALLPCDKFD
jgi:hypothetical protein